MEIQNYCDFIGNLVGQDKLKEAVNLLRKLLENSHRLNEVILQSSRLTGVEKQIREGTINFEDASLTKNKIRMAILSLTEEIRSIGENHDEVKKEINSYIKADENTSNRIQQNHSGKGDNIAGDKTINY